MYYSILPEQKKLLPLKLKALVQNFPFYLVYAILIVWLLFLKPINVVKGVTVMEELRSRLTDMADRIGSNMVRL